MLKPTWQFLSLALLSAACSINFGDLTQSEDHVSNVAFQISSNIHTLKVETFNGVLEVVEASEADSAAGKISGQSTAWASGETKEQANASAEAMEWIYSESGNVGTISISKLPGQSGNTGASLRWLNVPSHLTLDLESNNGNLQITGNFQDFNLETSNGRITMQLDDGWSGRGKADSSNGRIAVRCNGRLDCKLDMKTGNGTPKVLGPPLDEIGGKGSLHLRTSNGHIVVTHLFDSE